MWCRGPDYNDDGLFDIILEKSTDGTVEGIPLLDSDNDGLPNYVDVTSGLNGKSGFDLINISERPSLDRNGDGMVTAEDNIDGILGNPIYFDMDQDGIFYLLDKDGYAEQVNLEDDTKSKGALYSTFGTFGYYNYIYVNDEFLNNGFIGIRKHGIQSTNEVETNEANNIVTYDIPRYTKDAIRCLPINKFQSRPQGNTQIGISSLRSNKDADWFKDKREAHFYLETNKKPFVPNGIKDPETAIGFGKNSGAVEGMVVWDTDDKCLKMYSPYPVKTDNIVWHCIEKKVVCQNEIYRY